MIRCPKLKGNYGILNIKNHLQVLETHDFSTGMLQEKMKENERRRKRTSVDMDPELSQYLEDERLAIMLQNSEFLQELRGNEDFMQTLERGKQNNMITIAQLSRVCICID